MNKSELVKQLRHLTNAGMSDCIKALDASNNDIDRAIQWLRKNGAVKAAKKADAVAAEGIVKAAVLNNRLCVIEVNCQTDFVARNEKFVDFTNDVLHATLTQNVEKMSELTILDKSINDVALELTATIGEKINPRRMMKVDFAEGQQVGIYNHINNRFAAAILVDGLCDEQVLKNVCMHITSMGPKYLSEQYVDPEWIENERKFLSEQFKNELAQISNRKEREEKAKREEAIVNGKLKKSLDEICLLGQKLVTDPSKTVLQYLKENNVTPLFMVNFILGDGIEKKSVCFADEVAQQMGNK